MKATHVLSLLGLGALLVTQTVAAPVNPATNLAPLPAPAAASAKAAAITRIDPTFWWVGMKNPKLQLLVHGPAIGSSQVSLNYAGVTLEGTQKLENPNYLLVNLTIYL